MYALVDCNSFFCSCERVFRPDLKNRPIVVLSNNDGCVVSATKELKDLGIKVGDPYFKVKKICKAKRAAIFSSNFSIYGNMSDRVMNTIKEYSPRSQVYSIDEVFCDLKGVRDIEKHVRMIKQKVLMHTGIPVGIGVARTKVLSKLANHIAKQSSKSKGVVCLTNEELEDIALKRVPISKVWGIGKRSSEKLEIIGIKTAYDFKVYDNEALIQKMLSKVGVQIKHELMGIECFDIADKESAKKTIMCSRTFKDSIVNKDDLKQAISNYINYASLKLRRQGALCTSLSVFARTNAHKIYQPKYYMHEQIKLVNPTNDTRKLISQGVKLIDRGFKDGYEYKKAGAVLGNFFGQSEYQINFLEEQDSVEDQKLMKTVDAINMKIGSDIVRSASCGFDNKVLKIKKNLKSPRYLTSFDELLRFS
ncbi:MAG: Y-family DNA polymerase [Bacteriovoracaceae bacterium]|jgi:DNA polymerase V|nr:Y-family DNA polymerase [Bacteriovoracaceae bacterium]